MSKQDSQQNLNVQITDEVLRGAYANHLAVTHTHDEFILDFLTVFPPRGIVTSRVIVSPGHLKRIIRALAQNLEIYEQNHGPIPEPPAIPETDPPHLN